MKADLGGKRGTKIIYIEVQEWLYNQGLNTAPYLDLSKRYPVRGSHRRFCTMRLTRLLLLAGDENITEIALKCGFATPSPSPPASSGSAARPPRWNACL